MAVVKPEMKSYIWLQTTDGSIQQVEEEVAMFCPMICREIIQTGTADSLQLKPLVDLTSRALARIIEGKTPEEIRETFHLPDDLTEEEKLEPLKNITDDPRIRLLNRLYARKRKELKEREKLKNVEVEEEHVDERSVDDLLSFINGGDQDSKGVKTTKNKKKSRRRKEHLKDSSDNIDVNHNKELDDATAGCSQGNIDHVLVPSPSKTAELQDSAAVIFSPKVEFDDADMDDDIDPAMKEEIDREVEDFARRLNSDWPERMQEILSLGHERRLVPMSVNGDNPMSRFTSFGRR
ncbi:SKP1 component [Corchorus olitorius]|uniref:SKP1 component n=1 Tax=Corchorus olitorius TaxID=93759 RepID=A0A1R3HN05_9ROSI|nr:SKP1 component [Corchorus olitorius]